MVNPTRTSLALGQLLPTLDLPEYLKRLEITGMTIDSREVQRGDLFVAVKGLQVHGKAFIPLAKASGAVAVLIDAGEDVVGASVPVIKVDQLEARLSDIAGCFYGEPSKAMTIVGITGTNGKTTCTQLLAQAICRLQKSSAILGTMGFGVMQAGQNNDSLQLQETGLTTPDAIRTQKICAEIAAEGAEYLTMEISSHALDQGRVAGVNIDFAVFTNLTHDHLDYHGSMEAYGNAKARLFAMPSVRKAIINQDDAFAPRLIQTLPANCERITFSLGRIDSISTSAAAHFSLKDISMGSDGMRALLASPDGEFQVFTQLLGKFNLSNLLAVIAVLYADGFAIEAITKILPELRPVVGRMELVPNQLGIQVVVDYAHTPDALKNALEALVPHTKGKLWCVFGCGGDRDREKRPEMAKIAETYADEIIVTSDNPRKENPMQIFSDIEKGFQIPREVVVDRSTAIDYVITKASVDDVVLIAGKGHENYQLIGDKRFPFSDQQQARFSLRQREAEIFN